MYPSDKEQDGTAANAKTAVSNSSQASVSDATSVTTTTTSSSAQPYMTRQERRERRLAMNAESARDRRRRKKELLATLTEQVSSLSETIKEYEEDVVPKLKQQNTRLESALQNETRELLQLIQQRRSNSYGAVFNNITISGLLTSAVPTAKPFLQQQQANTSALVGGAIGTASHSSFANPAVSPALASNGALSPLSASFSSQRASFPPSFASAALLQPPEPSPIASPYHYNQHHQRQHDGM